MLEAKCDLNEGHFGHAVKPLGNLSPLTSYTSYKSQNHLNTGHDTAATPAVPRVANSSAFPLKSLMTFPDLTSNMLSTTL